MLPTVTIALPFLNPGRHFARALQSIFQQTFQDWELLLIDDGSTDDSLHLARSLTDSRVRVYSDGNNRGLAARLNEAADMATAPYFARMDADDLMHPHRLERQFAVIRKEAGAVVVGSLAYSIDDQGNIIGLRISSGTGFDFEARRSFIHPTVMYPVIWLRRHRYATAPVYYRCEDAELWCRTAAHTRFIVIPEPLLFYREGGQFSLRNYVGTSLGLICLLKERYNRPKARYLIRVMAEIAKVAVVALLDAFGQTDRLVAKRTLRLTPAEVATATSMLTSITSLEMPVASMRE